MQREESATEQRQAWFIHDRFGLFIHWGIYACAARHGDKGLAEWIVQHKASLQLRPTAVLPSEATASTCISSRGR